MDPLSIAIRVPDHIAELHREAAAARYPRPAGRPLLHMPHIDLKSALEPIRRSFRTTAW